MTEVELDQSPLGGTVGDYDSIELVLVEDTAQDELWNYMVKTWHYLGLKKIIGPRIKYLIMLGDRPIGGISYQAGSYKLGDRDAYIGWDDEQRLEMLCHVANQNRFLILPWIRIRNLASYILSRSLKRLVADWKKKYGSELYICETFVDASRYKGVCYRAAGWKHVGITKGYGREGKRLVYHGNRKHIFVTVMNPRIFKMIRPRQPRKTEREERLEMQLQKDIWYPAILKDAEITRKNMPKITEMFATYLYQYEECFGRRRPEPFQNFATYEMGLMSNLERKSVEPIALYVDGATRSVRYLQEFLSKVKWDHKKAFEIYRAYLSKELSEPDGMITIDGCDFPKKGKESPGVARQHCGPMGKTDNCQATVMLGYSGDKGYGLIDGKLYLPRCWFRADYRERWKKCHIPDGMEFVTKPKMAIDMLNEVIASGLFKGKWVGADGAFGSIGEFLDSIPEGYYYFADVHKDTHVFPSMPEMIVPEYSGKGKRASTPGPSVPSVRVDELISSTSDDWICVSYGEGSKGPIYGKEKCLRVVEARDKKPGKWVWLYARQRANGEIKYTLCNAPESMPIEVLRRQALRRWPIEQSFEECKSELGMDHFEGRSWLAFHRHLLLVFIAHFFLFIIRKTFSIKWRTSQPITNRPIGIKNAEVLNDLDPDSDVPILTASNSRRLFNAALKRKKTDLLPPTYVVEYHIRRNAIAHASHRKRTLLNKDQSSPTSS